MYEQHCSELNSKVHYPFSLSFFHTIGKQELKLNVTKIDMNKVERELQKYLLLLLLPL